MDKICQSCAMFLVKDEDYGTNADGSKNEDYCVYCFKDGEFTMDTTMEEMIELNLKYLDYWNENTGRNLTIEQAREELSKLFPTLKRWK